MRKKILIIPTWYPSPASPLNGIFVREQAECLSRVYDVTVLAPRFPSLADQFRLRWGPDLAEEDEGHLRTWRVRRLKIPTLRRYVPFLNDPDQALVYYRKFAAAVRRGFEMYVKRFGRPDLIHAHVVLPAGWVALELGRRADVPVVLTEHSEPFAMHLGGPGQRRLVEEVLLGADRVVAVSAALRQAVRAFCPAAGVDVLSNLIQTDFFTPGPPRSGGPFRFFVLAFLTERKGVQFLLPAVQTLQRQGRDYELIVGGDGPHRPALEQMARDLGVADRCRFLGRLDREQVRAEMRRCDAFVLPSLGETFGIVLGEAMACGKPVLATRCGGPEEVVTPETGVLVPPADPGALAGALVQFLDARLNFDAAAVRASVVNRYGADAFLRQYAELVAPLLDGPGARRRAFPSPPPVIQH